MANDRSPRGAHLVGSVPLPTAEEVFRIVGAALGDRLRRISDGETGQRADWFLWQEARFVSCPQLESAPVDAPGFGRRDVRRDRSKLQLRADVDPAAVTFDPPGYAADALQSYAVFARLKGEGVIPANRRFMVALPTPMTPAMAFTTAAAAPLVEPAYETALLAEVDELAAAIPHDQLAIQWDCSWEMAIWEGEWASPFPDARAGVTERLARLSQRVPPGVELGYHLCYGDYQHSHWKQPADAARLVEVANMLSTVVARPLNWVHLPVPRNRDDDAYFAPLRDLRLRPETELYLGLVHYTDGVEGTRRRIATAQKVVSAFGVAMECGWGRRQTATIPELLRIHREVSAPLV